MTMVNCLPIEFREQNERKRRIDVGWRTANDVAQADNQTIVM